MRSSEASTSSRADTSPARTIAASSPAGRNIRSLSGTGSSSASKTSHHMAWPTRPAPSATTGGCAAGRRPAASPSLPSSESECHDEVQTAPEVQSGLEGVVAFATEIAEPDRDGGALRYRGVDIEDLVGNVPYEQVWGLLVDGRFKPGLPPAEPHALTVRSGRPPRRRAVRAGDARARVGLRRS